MIRNQHPVRVDEIEVRQIEIDWAGIQSEMRVLSSQNTLLRFSLQSSNGILSTLEADALDNSMTAAASDSIDIPNESTNKVILKAPAMRGLRQWCRFFNTTTSCSEPNYASTVNTAFTVDSSTPHIFGVNGIFTSSLRFRDAILRNVMSVCARCVTIIRKSRYSLPFLVSE
jgi:hypothetical protein